ncbi:MAG: putative Zn-dependent protease [Halioglobus sp.]|jgi:predicted Zn-dependent protease
MTATIKQRCITSIQLLGLLASIALTTACGSTVTAGGARVDVPTESGGSETGREMYEKMIAQGAAYDDKALQDYVNRIGQSLATNTGSKNQKFTFTVLDSPDINAFATPGGYIYVNRGLMAYLDSEAELAGVIAHEIGHVTANHAGRQQTASMTNSVLAAMAYVVTGSRDVADASTMAGTALVRGYGRDHELEADSLGAQTMHKTGYDTDALLEVIGVLKDQEQYQRVKAKSSGKKVSSYHGLYATHPRNDARLQQVISTARDLDQDAENPAKPGEFRKLMEGLVWGASSQGLRSEDRYYHNKLGFTFARPKGWTVTANAKAIVAFESNSKASLTVTIRKRDKTSTAQNMLEKNTSGSLSNAAELEQSGLKGYTAVASSSNASRRVAVIDFNGLSYLFEGKADDFGNFDPILLEMVKSFRPSHPKEKKAGDPAHVHYIQVPRGATLETLASGIRTPDAEAQLRLMNGFYPRGEPRTGDWIKVIR